MATEWSVESDPILAPIRAALEIVLKHGLRPAKLAAEPGSWVLAHELPENATPLEHALAVEAAVEEVLAEIGDGPAGRALRLLLGARAESRSLPLKTRRRLAAEEVDVMPDTFRRLYESGLLDDMATCGMARPDATRRRSDLG